MNDKKTTDFDAIVIGSGFAGIYMLHKLRNELGLKVRAFDAAGGVGGTWFWNRYPGATSDSEGFVYRYSWDKEMLQEWDWDTRYVSQPHTLSYLEAVVKKHDLAKDIQLNTQITGAEFDDASSTWTVTTRDGESFSARYLLTGLGPLSTTYFPAIKGRDSFQGTMVHTGAWPADLSLEGKRVGVIGTGSTGTGFICAAAKTAGHLTVFQRTAQYNVPSGNGPITPEYVAEIRANYDKIWADARNSFAAAGFAESHTPAMSVSSEEQQAGFQKAWDQGNGFRFMFGAFSDVAMDPAANEIAAEFIRTKIREIVKDPETARKLSPTDLYAKRPIANKDYYESFNQDNVSLVSVKENPIREITPAGILTEDGVLHELDVLVFATGFDAVDGSYRRMNLRGRKGETIQQHWEDRPTSFLGTAVNGFPNMFMIYGPNSAFSNIPPCIEIQVEWVTELIKAAEERGSVSIETTKEAEDGWVELCQQTADHTLFPKADSYFFGANIPGKKRRNMFFFGGIAGYLQKLKSVTDGDYEGFVLEEAPAKAHS